MTRVLIVSAWDPRSGVVGVYRALASHLGARGVRFSAFAFDGWGEDTLWTFCDELIDGRRTTLAHVLISGRYDLLHCIDSAYSPPYGVETWVRRARFRGPIVLMSQLAKRELAGPVHATRYIAPSAEAAQELAVDADGPVAVIPTGYDEALFRRVEEEPGPTDEGRPLLVWIGRTHDRQKGIELFLDAIEQLTAYDGLIVDENPEATAIKNRLALLGNRVQHLGRVEPRELAGIYRRAAASGGAYVSTSRYEGFPIAVLEALACGCPVVAPRVPGLQHLVDGETAVIYDRACGPVALASALERLDDPATREAIVSRGAAVAQERWTSRRMADAYFDVYTEALETVAASGKRRPGDSLLRIAWRCALAVRPYWQKASRLLEELSTTRRRKGA